MQCRITRRRALLRVEPLEGRALLSGLSTPLVPLGPIVLPNEPVLRGVMKGMYTTQDRIPDVGRSWSVHAIGGLSGVGLSSIRGTLHGTGFILQGRPGGTLTVANSGGTMTISLVGPPQAGFSGLPTRFTYKVTSATGRDRPDLNATGTLTVALLPNHPGNPNSPGKVVIAISMPTPGAPLPL